MTPERWKQIEELFLAAIERAPGERAAFLADACQGDEQMRDELLAMLSSHESESNLLDEPPFHLPGVSIGEDEPGRDVGEHVGQYQILYKLGEGGMGKVYLAADSRLDRKVALKVLSGEFTPNKDLLRRFEQEARFTSALSHPNVCIVYEIGKTSEGLHFISMEYAEGATLRQLMKSGPLELGRVLDIGRQVADALRAAHGAGIIHRDIKPENITVREDGHVKVLDFGVAKLTEREHAPLGSSSALTTDPGLVMGTPRYMSPEQIRGLKVDARTDVWSLGCVLYEMATGHAPFEGQSVGDVIASILKSEPEPLSLGSSRASARFQRIISRALAKDSAERYRSVKELLADLEGLARELEHEPGVAGTAPRQPFGAAGVASDGSNRSMETTSRLATRTIKAERAGSTSFVGKVFARVAQHKLAALTLLALIVVGAAALYLYRPAAGGRAALNSIAILPFVNESGDQAADWLSDGLTESIINDLSQLPGLTVKARSSVFRYKGQAIDPQEVGRALQVQAVLTGRIAQHGDEYTISTELVNATDGSRIWGTQYTRRAQDMQRLQGEVARDVSESLRLKLTGEDRKRLAKNYTGNTAAYQLYLQGRYYWNKRSLDGVKKSVELYNQALEKDPEYALAYVGLSNSYFTLTTLGSMTSHEGEAKSKAAALRAVELDGDLAEAHASLGAALAFADWDWQGAEQEYKRALELNPGSADVHYLYGEICKVEGRLEEAISQEERARELDPLSIPILTNLGRTYVYAHQPDRGLDLIRKALEMDPTFGRARRGVVEAYIEKGMFAEALREVKEKDPAEVGAQGFLYARLGQRDLALQAVESLKKQSAKSPVSPIDLAFIYSGLGDNDQAFFWLEQAFQEHNFQLIFLKIHPFFSGLRSDPRYANIVRRMNLTP